MSSNGEVEYSKVPIVSNRTSYVPGDDLDLNFKKCNKVLDLNNLELIFKFVKTTDSKLGFPWGV